MPSYPPDERDLRTFRLAGLDLPIRATVAVVAIILIVIFDFQRTLIPDELVQYDRNPGDQRLQARAGSSCSSSSRWRSSSSGSATGRARYGLRLGDWRWGLGLAVAGCAVMTPIVLLLVGRAGLPRLLRAVERPAAVAPRDERHRPRLDRVHLPRLPDAGARPRVRADRARRRPLPVHLHPPDEARDASSSRPSSAARSTAG